MRTSLLLTLALAPALIAQTPPPQDFAQPLAVQGPAIEKLLKAFRPQEALDQAERLLPTAEPRFDKTNPNTALASSFQFKHLANSYHLAGRAALAAGCWEKARDYFSKARQTAQSNLEQATQILTPVLETWKTPLETAKKALDEGAARLAELGAKPSLTPDEDAELRNFQVQKQNLKIGTSNTETIRRNLADLKTRADAFTPMIDSVEKAIAAEKAHMDQELAGKAYRGNRAAYLAATLNPKNLEIRETKLEKLNFLNRLQCLCAGSPQADQVKAVIERVRLDQEPFPVAKSSKKKSNS